MGDTGGKSPSFFIDTAQDDSVVSQNAVQATNAVINVGHNDRSYAQREAEMKQRLIGGTIYHVSGRRKFMLTFDQRSSTEGWF